jgi:hypothetical protein
LAVREALPGIFEELRGLAQVHSGHADEAGLSRFTLSAEIG